MSMITDKIGKTRSENNNLREMYLRIKEEKQVITKKGSSTQGVI